MSALELESRLRKSEMRVMDRLTTPRKIQDFLDGIVYNHGDGYRTPLQTFRERKGHCYDGALFAAMALSRIGFPPLIVDLIPNDRDDDHVIAVFRERRRWGAVAKSNYTGLRYREPVYLNLRELVMSYFEVYFNPAGEKTLRGYTTPLNLNPYDKIKWAVNPEAPEVIAQKLDEIKRFRLVTRAMEDELGNVDKRSLDAGLLGSVKAGLYKVS
ncbi:MAG: transglutaminase-like domain-containing protein [Planctomycetes bacterium]|nr:transglutaminase-like domain-containing protein [Planctomycetota bacterium]